MRVFLKLFWILFLFEGCANKNPYKDMPDGINEIYYPDGKVHKRLYVEDGKLNGIYMEFDEKGKVIQTSAFRDNKRNGLWDTILPDKGLIQYFFNNDTIIAINDHKFFFHTYFFEDKNLGFTCQKNWHLEEDSSDGGELSIRGESIKFKGHFIPSYVISRKESNFKSVEAFIDSGFSEDKRSGIMDIREAPDMFFRKIVVDSDTIDSDNKVIKNNFGYWMMTCLASDSNYPNYQFLFKTMLNSFNPIKVGSVH